MNFLWNSDCPHVNNADPIDKLSFVEMSDNKPLPESILTKAM